VQIKSRSLSNLESKNPLQMLRQEFDDKIEHFLERKFRVSRSFATKKSYKFSLHRFEEFLRIKYNLDINQILVQVKDTKILDSLDVLDEYYAILSKSKYQERK